MRKILSVGVKARNIFFLSLLIFVSFPLPAHAIWDVKREKEFYAACLAKKIEDHTTEKQNFLLDSITIEYRGKDLTKSYQGQSSIYGIISNYFGISLSITMKPVNHQPRLCSI